MLTRLLLEDFQCHERLDLRLGRVTSIVGRTDAGKSSILRALRWLCLNRPAGDAFVRHGAAGVSVTAWAGRKRVRRAKGPGRNEYRIDGERFVAFGAGVPDAVASLLNADDLNFSRQHDAPFWFALSPGEVSRELNALVDLALIDRTLAAAAADLRRTRAEGEVAAGRLEEARRQRQRLAWVPAAILAAGGLERKLAALDEAQKRASRLADLLGGYQRAARAAEVAYKRAQALQRAVAAGAAWAAAREKRDRLVQLTAELELRRAGAPPTLDGLEAAAGRLREAAGRRDRLAALLSRWREAEGRRCASEKEARDAKGRHDRALATLGRCPACGAPTARRKTRTASPSS